MSSGPDILSMIPQQTQSCCDGPSSLHVSAAGAKWQAAHPLAGEVAASHLPGDDILLRVIVPHARIANLQGMCKHTQHAFIACCCSSSCSMRRPSCSCQPGRNTLPRARAEVISKRRGKSFAGSGMAGKVWMAYCHGGVSWRPCQCDPIWVQRDLLPWSCGQAYAVWCCRHWLYQPAQGHRLLLPRAQLSLLLQSWTV